MDNYLAHLLSPLDANVFFERYWAKGHLHLQRSGAHYADWLTVEDLNLFFQSEQLPAASVNVVSEGVEAPLDRWSRLHASARGPYRAVDTEPLFAQYLLGNTLILNQADLSIPALSRARRLLTREFGCRVWINIYITPPHAKGFSRHRDDHEVFVLQILGSKFWTICPREQDPVELHLQPGGLLYLPRLTEHEARSSDETSVHLTVGITPAYGFDLIEELALIAKKHPDFQQPVPNAFSTAQQQRDFEQELAGRLALLLSDFPVGDLIRRHSLSSELVNNQSGGWPGRFSEIIGLQSITLDTVVQTRAPIVFSITRKDSSLIVDFSGRQIRIPAFLRECLDKIVSGEPFAVGELEGLLSEEGKKELARFFVRSGLLKLLQ